MDTNRILVRVIRGGLPGRAFAMGRGFPSRVCHARPMRCSKDADRGMQLQGGGDYGLIDPNTINLTMGEIGDYGGDQTILNAGADGGIAEVDDGGTWGGCSGLELPYT